MGGELNKSNFMVAKARFSDFNLQGILRAALYMDFVIECQLDQFERRMGIDINSYSARGERWHITEYFIRVKRPIRSREAFIVKANLIGVLENRIRVRYRFLMRNHRTVYAEGYTCFDVVDDETNEPKPIAENDRKKLAKFVDESEN